jgi:hypothetical protein
MLFKRSDWNKLIDDVNAVITNPPGGCPPRPPLPHAGPRTRWKESHIRRIQEAISATCPDIVWPSIPLRLKASTLRTLREKLAQAWCKCQCDPKEGDGATVVFFQTEPPRVYSPCYGDDTLADSTVLLCSVINGVQLGSAGICSRIWRVREKQIFNDGHENERTIASGLISCNGTVTCNGTRRISLLAGSPSVLSATCDEAAQNATAISEAWMAQNPGLVYRSVFMLVVDSTSAYCCDC